MEYDGNGVRAKAGCCQGEGIAFAKVEFYVSILQRTVNF